MAEVKASTSRGAAAAEVVGEASCSGADASTYPGSVPSPIAAESPSFLTWMWIQILTACSGVWGARGGGLSGPGLACGAQWTEEDSESEVSSRMAASKPTWSEVRGRDSVSVPCPSQLSVWEELKESNPRFFRDDWVGVLEVGRRIGEGAQAQIFEAKLKGREEWDLVLKGREEWDLVFKLFKLDAGFSLADLKCHWPRSMRKAGEDRGRVPGLSELGVGIQEKSSMFVFDDANANVYGGRCLIHIATLLRDGSFAFVMERYWGDLRTLIDQKVKGNTHPSEVDFIPKNRRNVPPFSCFESIWIISQIARGMQGLHAEGVLHRDLKAANVLITSPGDYVLFCRVADYECAMFVQGTGFWRAPEVLRELQKREEKDRNDEIWTEKVDIYSFGMTCYEILTGQIPFSRYTRSKWGDVLRGERPSLPNYVFPELRELVEACWHAQPSERPSFEDIIEKLASLPNEHRVWK